MLALKLFNYELISLAQRFQQLDGVLTIERVDWEEESWRLELCPKGEDRFIVLDERDIDSLREMLDALRDEINRQRWECFWRSPMDFITAWFPRACARWPWAQDLAAAIHYRYLWVRGR
jgi:hypothetical protein